MIASKLSVWQFLRRLLGFESFTSPWSAPESHYVLDGILGNQTDLLPTEHATDKGVPVTIEP